MTKTDQIKILDRKITQNEARYDLDRKAAEISALSSNNFDKFEYLTGEDLDLKPSTVEQTKFEYSPLGKIFNKSLDEKDKKEGILKRLENIKDKNEELLNSFSTTKKFNKALKINNQSKNLIYNTQHSFTKFKIWTKEYKRLKNQVLINAGNLYNDFYYIYKNKYVEEINSLDTESKKSLTTKI